MNKQQTIVWDQDDVLNDLTESWFSEYSIRNNMTIKFDELTKNPPHEILKISLQEYLASLDSFRSAKYSQLPPKIEVLNWFKTHGYKFSNAVLSAVPLKFADVSAEWLFRHFGNWIRSFHFVPSPRKDDNFPVYAKDKIEILLSLYPNSIFIDDNENNVKQAKKSGIKALLFPRQWNSNSNIEISKFLYQITEL